MSRMFFVCAMLNIMVCITIIHSTNAAAMLRPPASALKIDTQPATPAPLESTTPFGNELHDYYTLEHGWHATIETLPGGLWSTYFNSRNMVVMKLHSGNSGCGEMIRYHDNGNQHAYGRWYGSRRTALVQLYDRNGDIEREVTGDQWSETRTVKVYSGNKVWYTQTWRRSTSPDGLQFHYLQDVQVFNGNEFYQHVTVTCQSPESKEWRAVNQPVVSSIVRKCQTPTISCVTGSYCNGLLSAINFDGSTFLTVPIDASMKIKPDINPVWLAPLSAGNWPEELRPVNE
jgi:hypothetical protein